MSAQKPAESTNQRARNAIKRWETQFGAKGENDYAKQHPNLNTLRESFTTQLHPLEGQIGPSQSDKDTMNNGLIVGLLRIWLKKLKTAPTPRQIRRSFKRWARSLEKSVNANC